MASYTYTDESGHMQAVQHGMIDNPVIVCACGLDMWRMPPQSVSVSWGGLSPSNSINRSVEVEDFINPNNVDERLDDYERKNDGRP